MAVLIKNRAPAADDWTLLRTPESISSLDDAKTPGVLVPLSFWMQNRDALNASPYKIGVWLDSHEVPAALADDVYSLEVIALHFPVFTDGRPYSSARELRQKYRYQGELRAVGDVLRDQLFYMSRCGFDAFVLREDQSMDAALAAFEDFQEGYQPSIDRPEPLFRRRGELA